MKKTIAILLCAAMILTLAACGSGSGSSQDDTGSVRTEISKSDGNKSDGNKSEEGVSGDNQTGSVSEKSSADSSKDDISAGAADSQISAFLQKYPGLSEDELKWDYNSSEKTLIISGEGPMRDYLDEAPEWDQYSAEAKHVVIGDKVTSVGSGAFMWFSELTDVKLGESVELIGAMAFSDCYCLESVNFPDTLKYVGNSAFLNALLHSNQGFVFPEGMLCIEQDAFYSAFKESYVSIPASLIYIGPGAFANCFVEEFRVDPSNPAYASDNGSLYDKDMTALINYPADQTASVFEIPDTVTAIYVDAIAVTNSLEKIVIPASVSVIDEAAIYWNYGLRTIEVDENNQNYKSEDGVLYTADGKLLLNYPAASDRTEYTIAPGCERLGKYSLSQATGLTELHIGEGLQEIGDSALYGCTQLTQIGLPKSLQIIEDSAFCWCDSLTRVDYAGNQSDWSQVIIGEKNDCLADGSVEIHVAD